MRVIAMVLALVAAWPRPAVAEECARATIWRDGRARGTTCRADAPARRLTTLDLGDDWTPAVLAAPPDGPAPAYRATYLALAQERFADAGHEGALARTDRYLELFGVSPSLGVVRARLADDARHRCHAEVDATPLAAAPERIVEETPAAGRQRVARLDRLRAELDHARRRHQRDDLAALAEVSTYFRRQVDRLSKLEAHDAAVRAVQAHLACDALLAYPPIAGAYTWHTANAVQRFQRGVMLLPTGTLDAATREAFARDSRIRDFQTALRVLRERVVAATGLVEDGSAGAGPATVLGHALVPDSLWQVPGHAPLEDAAPDHISLATEAAARALGWLDPASTLAFLDAQGFARTVAVPLPPPPRYHGGSLRLTIEIDRGDVWYDPVPRRRRIERRPAILLYAMDGARRIALARWPTTIGGWQDERVGDEVIERWKESPAGPRVWRDLYVGPRWLPPASTPDRELVRRVGDRHVLARELLGPSYRAAFGLISLVHLVERPTRDGVVRWDQGIRTHGTGNLPSLARGVSHGCHRVLGLHVVRLAGFLLAHHPHTRHGDAPTWYRRTLRHRGTFPVAIDTLGYRIELQPPIAVEVLPGRVHR